MFFAQKKCLNSSVTKAVVATNDVLRIIALIRHYFTNDYSVCYRKETIFNKFPKKKGLELIMEITAKRLSVLL